MKKKIIIILIIILMIIGTFVFKYLSNKDKTYNPTVDYQDEIIWDDIEKTYISFDGNNII